MKNKDQKNHRHIATFVHLLSFGKWVFPLGNFVLPIILWTVNSKKSEFIDFNGKEVINFQLSITLYTVILALIGGGVIMGTMISGGPLFWESLDDGTFLFNEDAGILSTIMASGLICGTAILVLTILDVVCTIKAAVRANEGKDYYYPITIRFIRHETIDPASDELDSSYNKESTKNESI